MTARRRRREPVVKPIGGQLRLAEGWNAETGLWVNESVAGRAIGAIRLSNTLASAAKWAGIHERTLMSWLQKGRIAAAALPSEVDEDDPDERLLVPEAERIYFDFLVAVDRAEASSEVDIITNIHAAARQDWKAGIALVSRRHRKTWGDKVEVEHTGPGGGPVQVVHDLELARQIANNPEARRMASDLLALVAPVAPPDNDEHSTAE